MSPLCGCGHMTRLRSCQHTQPCLCAASPLLGLSFSQSNGAPAADGHTGPSCPVGLAVVSGEVQVSALPAEASCRSFRNLPSKQGDCPLAIELSEYPTC